MLTDDRKVEEPTATSLKSSVIDGGYCVGCGACAAAPGSAWSMTFQDGRYLPQSAAPAPADDPALAVCPFSDSAPNEDEWARRLYSDLPAHPQIGRVSQTFVGHLLDDEMREKSSSGGLTSWLIGELFARGEIDRVIHSSPNDPDSGEPLYRFGVSTVENYLAGRKSHYFPVEISGVVEMLRTTPGRYAFVGVPCMVKAIRNLSLQSPEVAERVRVVIGIVCGHMKTAHFAEALAWEMGVPSNDVQAVDFRVKAPGGSASSYAASATSRTTPQAPAVQMMRDSRVADWGAGWFRVNACEYCDDVLAECADVAFGDAWLPKFDKDWRGTNCIVTRRADLGQLLTDGADEGRIRLVTVTPDDIAASQASGIRHRREGLAYRLSLKREQGLWAPRKRVSPDSAGISAERRMIYRLRLAISQASIREFMHAKSVGSYAVFLRRMTPLVFFYKLVQSGWKKRVKLVLRLPLQIIRGRRLW
ncbi:MAG: Coenzyme F420 hydrogenase/dehydrogenase, beta subunit C-terminal domain [Caulobacter sp.]